ncbi:response regulator [Frateuria hangzhouensis]|uniref:response regulator n=1 Tax=Frateuria hangzhouensis TaxID=2995589 RepID=UPI002260E9B0|nr:response regulator [Frateuria sp. STR12]MCX7513899.1 response regulator [Frateuria sp. STR12]
MAHEIRLLVVDDNIATRYAVKRTLEHRGCFVLEAGTGTEGLALLREYALDALILDVNLPDANGFDIVRQLRQEPETVTLPIVHVSATSTATGDLVTGLNAGADAYLTHPVDPDVLLATLRTLLRVRDTERELHDAEARFREIFAHVAAPIAVIDAALDLHESNAAFARLLPGTGRLAECLAGGQQQALEELRSKLLAGERWQGSLSLHAGTGRRETVWRVVPYRTPGLGLLFVEDVTDQRERERRQQEKLSDATARLAREREEHAHTEAQLRQAQKMDALGRLTGGIAHDFNNLLTGIITGIELINRRVEEGRLDIQRFSGIALESAQRAAALTHRLLAFARQQPLDARPVDVNESIRSLGELLTRTMGERIALQFNLANGPMIARIDASQLENAVLNLVINARDAINGDGSVCVSTARVQAAGSTGLADGDYIALAVSDNGCGIPSEVLERVFEPFFTTKPTGKGTGLGLSMIYGFARQSGGDVRITSIEGEGTEVTLLVPADRGDAPAAIELPRSLEQGRGEHVLLVEDMPAVRLLVSDLLAEAGYRCTRAADIESALRALRSDEPIDLLITDVGLPGMNGRDLAEMARGWRPDLPVLFVTGYAENAVAREEFLDEGMDMLAKPFEIDRLLGKVRSMLGR